MRPGKSYKPLEPVFSYETPRFPFKGDIDMGIDLGVNIDFNIDLNINANKHRY